jgi:hypothetical protein
MKPTTLRLDRLEARLAPAVATWDGGGADNHWTTAANWVGDIAPQPGDDLVFPVLTNSVPLLSVNDFPDGTAFHSIHVGATFYPLLSGNRIGLAAGLSVEAGGFANVGLPLTLTAGQTFSDGGQVPGPTPVSYNVSGPLDLNGHTLTIDGQGFKLISGPITGTGSLDFAGGSTALTGVSTFAGPTTVSLAQLDVAGTLPGPVTVLQSRNGTAELSGSGTVGAVTVDDQLTGGDTLVNLPSQGTLKTGNLSLADTSQATISIPGALSANGLAVTGTVQVGGRLVLSGEGTNSPLLPGTPYTLINNDGTDPVVGTFAGVPEGALIHVGTNVFRITYHGGDGNDVVATTVPASALVAYAVGAGPGGVPLVNVYNDQGELFRSFLAYASAFRGGVRVATADINGDGVPDIITAPGPGGGPHVRVFDGVTFAVITEFMAYDPRFTGGVFVAAANLETNSTRPDIITGAGAGGGPHVKVYASGTLLSPIGPVENAVISSFFAYDPAFRGGVSVAGTDEIGGSTPGKIITGAGPGGGPHVKVFDATTLNTVSSFFAFDPSFRGGVNVAARGFNGTIVASPAVGSTEVRLFNLTGGPVGSFTAYDPRFLGGVTVASLGIDLTSGNMTVVTGAGPGGGPHVKTWLLANGVAMQEQSFFAFDPAFRGGVFVG